MKFTTVVRSVADIRVVRVGDIVRYKSHVTNGYNYGRVLHIGPAFGVPDKDAVWCDWRDDEKGAINASPHFDPGHRNGLTYANISESQMVVISDRKGDRIEIILGNINDISSSDEGNMKGL